MGRVGQNDKAEAQTQPLACPNRPKLSTPAAFVTSACGAWDTLAADEVSGLRGLVEEDGADYVVRSIIHSFVMPRWCVC